MSKLNAAIGGAVFVDLPDGYILKDPNMEFRRPNPAFISHEQRRRNDPRAYSGIKPPPKWINACGRVDSGPYRGRAWFPRHGAIRGRLPGMGAAVVDHRTFPAFNGQPGAVDLDRELCLPASSVTLRPYQADAVAAFMAARNGIIVAPCGAGKTAIGCGVIGELPTPALVLVHTRDLLAQWVARLKSTYPGITVGEVYGGKNTTGRVVVAMVHSLAKRTWQQLHHFGSGFGLVILDEAHHCPARTFCRVMAGLPAWYRLGLTATPDRQDGLTAFMYWTFGDAVATITAREMQQAGRTLPATVYQAKTGAPSAAFRKATKPHERAAAIAADAERNAIIVGAAHWAIGRGRVSLVIVNRVQHARDIAAAIGPMACAFVGDMKAKERSDVLTRAGLGLVRVVVSTTIADEGLDLPVLDTVILATPTGNTSRVVQRIGRALRPDPNNADKRPIVVDLCDGWGPYRGYAKRRAAAYRGNGWTVRNGWPDETRAAGDIRRETSTITNTAARFALPLGGTE